MADSRNIESNSLAHEIQLSIKCYYHFTMNEILILFVVPTWA